MTPETTDPRIAEILEQLYLRAAERDDDRGCEHTTQFGDWCARCRAQEVQTMRDAADALASLQQRVEELERHDAERLIKQTAEIDAKVRQKVQGEIAELRERVEALTQEKQKAVVAGWCDVCLGTGKPMADVPCMCGGSGLAADAAIYLRVRLLKAEQRLEAAERERDEFKTLAKVGTWHDDCRPNRQMAARELAKSQAVIDKRADTVSTLKAIRRACSCAQPDPVMQVDGKFYCYACSFETGARPISLEPENWFRAKEAAEATIARLRELSAHWRRDAARLDDQSVVSSCAQHAAWSRFNADELDAVLASLHLPPVSSPEEDKP